MALKWNELLRLRKNLRQLIVAISLLIASLIGGIVAYTSLEGYTLNDSLYMAVITISTVGFTEVRPLSPGGRLFTSFYVIVNLVILAYAVGTIASYVFEGELNRIFKTIISDRKLSKFRDHIIVCGLGRNGIRACEELLRSEEQFIIIEQDQEVINRLPEQLRQHYIIGDGTTDDILNAANIAHARCIITTLPKDADNVFITLTARELNPNIYIISRASEEVNEKKLRRAGVDRVVMPETLGGLHMAHLVTRPYVIEFLDLISGIGNVKLELEEVAFDELKAPYQNKTIRELDVRNPSVKYIFQGDCAGLNFGS